MDKRAARREAWTLAANLVEAAITSGLDFAPQYPDATEDDIDRIDTALYVVLDAMRRRGRR